MNSKAILIVDDDLDIRQNLSEILKIEGYETQMAEHGQAALDLLLAHRSDLPSLIILDLSMPVMDGLTFLRTLHEKHGDDLARVPILVATARGDPLDPAAVPIPITYLRKPLDLDKLLEAVEQNLGKPR